MLSKSYPYLMIVLLLVINGGVAVVKIRYCIHILSNQDKLSCDCQNLSIGR